MKTNLKIKILRRLVAFREYANTENGERVIVRTLTVMSALFIVDLTLLVVGSIMS